MKADLELNLIHDGEQWVGRHADFTVAAPDLFLLEEKVRQALVGSGRYPGGSRVTVFMGYDFDSFPVWLRQYHSHYFNRFVSFTL